MIHHDTFLRCLEAVDIEGARAIWKEVAPHLPQPKSDADVLASIHAARTASKRIQFKLRAYSHAWLLERGLPSSLPDHLKPRAERIYPRIVDAVGVAVKFPPHRRELGEAVRKAMSDVVLDCYASGMKDPDIIRSLMNEARIKVLKGD